MLFRLQSHRCGCGDVRVRVRGCREFSERGALRRIVEAAREVDSDRFAETPSAIFMVASFSARTHSLGAASSQRSPLSVDSHTSLPGSAASKGCRPPGIRTSSVVSSGSLSLELAGLPLRLMPLSARGPTSRLRSRTSPVGGG